jgi:hypothetical protein
MMALNSQRRTGLQPTNHLNKSHQTMVLIQLQEVLLLKAKVQSALLVITLAAFFIP